MANYYRKVGSVKKTFPNPVPTEQYEKPLGPERPTATQRFESDHPLIAGAARKTSTFVKERGAEIAREAQHQRPPSRTPTQGLPADPFGMGGRGNPFNSNPFGVGQYGHPFNGAPGPIINDRAPPRKPTGGTTRTIYKANGDVEVIRSGARKSSRKKRSGGSSAGNVFSNPMGIPKSMRHLF